MTSSASLRMESLFRSQERRLWGLAYRLTGSAEDADDIVQESFARLLHASLERSGEELARWLARVATHLGIDALRRRKRRSYVGPWLPSPLETADPEGLDTLRSAEPSAEVRYGLAESVTHAFLISLEALGPRERAALVLRDVLGHSASESATLLGVSEGNLRILHLRARRKLASYDGDRCIPTPELRERHRLALERFLVCLTTQDARGLETLLAESVDTVTDAAGKYTALAQPMRGRAKVARFYLAAAQHRKSAGVHIAMRVVNGLPAALITLDRPVRRQAPASLLQCVLSEDGCIRRIHTILAPQKLRALLSETNV